MKTQPVTIQLNSLEALERLIGGSSQIEVDIRNSVVQRFAEKHLKCIANDSQVGVVVDKLKRDLQAAIEKLITEQVGTINRHWNGTIESARLNPEILKEIDGRVKSASTKLVDDAVAVVLAQVHEGLAERIEKAVQMRVDYEIGQEVKKRVSATIQRALEGK